MEISQYDIVLLHLDHTLGGEMTKTRPCVVISPDEMNRHLRTVVVAPMTTQTRLYPTRMKIRFQHKTGWIAVDQIRTVDRKRIIKTLGVLRSSEIGRLKHTIRETYVE